MSIFLYIPVIFWVSIIIIGIIIETLTLNFVSMWFSVGAFTALIALSLGINFTFQLIIFLIFSFLTILFLRPFVKNILKFEEYKTNFNKIIGETGCVTEKISNNESIGQIKVCGQIWSAKSIDNNVINVGEFVEILSISGVKAVVSKKERVDT